MNQHACSFAAFSYWRAFSSVVVTCGESITPMSEWAREGEGEREREPPSLRLLIIVVRALPHK